MENRGVCVGGDAVSGGWLDDVNARTPLECPRKSRVKRAHFIFSVYFAQFRIFISKNQKKQSLEAEREKRRLQDSMGFPKWAGA